jgi:hypothetical protein
MTADASLVVGISDSFDAQLHAIVWTPQLGTRTLTSFFTAAGVNLQGWTLDQPAYVSADGTRFAGAGIDPSGRPEAYLVTIPSPACAPAFLATLGLVALPRARLQTPSNSAHT